jgi:hypothetical protein
MQALLLANSQPRGNPRRRLATAECETDVRLVAVRDETGRRRQPLSE